MTVTGIDAANGLYKAAPQRGGIDPNQTDDFGTVFDAAKNLVDDKYFTEQGRCRAGEVCLRTFRQHA